MNMLGYLDLFPEIRNNEIYTRLDNLSKMVYNYVFPPQPLPSHYRPLIPLTYKELVQLMRASSQLFDFFESYSPSKDIINFKDVGRAAARSGNLEVLKHFITEFEMDTNIYKEAIKGGNLEVIEYIHNIYKPDYNDLNFSFRMAGKKNNWPLIERLTKISGHTFDYPNFHQYICFIGAISGGNMHFLKFVQEEGSDVIVNRLYLSGFYGVSKIGSVETLKWLMNIGYKPIINNVNLCSDINVIEFILDNDMKFLKGITDIWTDDRYDTKYTELVTLGSKGYIEMLKLLILKKLINIKLEFCEEREWGSGVFTDHVKRLPNNLFDMFDFLDDGDCRRMVPFGSLMNWDVYYILEGAVRKDQWKVIKWLHESDSLIKDSFLCELCYSWNAYRSYLWLIDHGYPLSELCRDMAIYKGDYYEFNRIQHYLNLSLNIDNALHCAVAGLFKSKNLDKQRECCAWVVSKGCKYDENLFVFILAVCCVNVNDVFFRDLYNIIMSSHFISFDIKKCDRKFDDILNEIISFKFEGAADSLIRSPSQYLYQFIAILEGKYDKIKKLEEFHVWLDGS